MKVKLSDQAASVLLDLYQRSGETGNVTHFLNKLICKQEHQFPYLEDKNNASSTNPSLPTLQH